MHSPSTSTQYARDIEGALLDGLMTFPRVQCRTELESSVTSVKVVENAGMDWQPSVMRRRLLQ